MCEASGLVACENERFTAARDVALRVPDGHRSENHRSSNQGERCRSEMPMLPM